MVVAYYKQDSVTAFFRHAVRHARAAELQHRAAGPEEDVAGRVVRGHDARRLARQVVPGFGKFGRNYVRFAQMYLGCSKF